MPIELSLGDVFLVKFHPGTGQELKRYRPAVVVSTAVHHHDQRFVMIAPLTTQLSREVSSLELVLDPSDVPCLTQTSAVLLWYLWTIDIRRLTKKLGQLPTNRRSQMVSRLRLLF